MPVFGTRTLWLAQILIVILVIYLVIAARAFLLVGPAPTTAEEVFLRLPVMIYLGWATLAAAMQALPRLFVPGVCLLRTLGE